MKPKRCPHDCHQKLSMSQHNQFIYLKTKEVISLEQNPRRSQGSKILRRKRHHTGHDGRQTYRRIYTDVEHRMLRRSWPINPVAAAGNSREDTERTVAVEMVFSREKIIAMAIASDIGREKPFAPNLGYGYHDQL